MKTKSSKFVTKALAALALAMLGSSSFAASDWTKDLQVDCSANQQSQACANLPATTITAWTTGTGSPSSPTIGSTFTSTALVYNWGSAGLGIVSGNENSAAQGPHAIDNGYGIEAMMLTFAVNAPVNLSSLTIGWNGTDNPCTSTNNGTGGCTSTSNKKVNYNDSDLSVLAWTGVPGSTAAPTMAASGLLSAGWTLVGNYADVGASNGIGSTPVKQGGTATVTSAIYSSYWLISAYSSSYFSGNSTAETNAGLNGGNDSFKLLSIAGNFKPTDNSTGNKVPEPGSIALLGLGLVGMAVARRRKQASM